MVTILVKDANETEGKLDTAYGYPHQDIINYGEAAIPILEAHLNDQYSTSVTLTQNPLSYEGFDANYFVKRIKGTTPTLSVGEFSYFCIAMILKSRPSCYLKQKHSKEINELISQECLDYDGKVSDAGVAAIQKIAEQSQIDDVEDWRLE